MHFLCRVEFTISTFTRVTAYVHIGNTKAPLLAVIPFHVTKSCNRLKEKNFKQVMYVPVIADCISQIDIGIYDGTRQLIPFTRDTATALLLHFRQLQCISRKVSSSSE